MNNIVLATNLFDIILSYTRIVRVRIVVRINIGIV